MRQQPTVQPPSWKRPAAVLVRPLAAFSSAAYQLWTHALVYISLCSRSLFASAKINGLWHAGTPLPVLWTIELLPDSDTEGGFCAGEFDLGCIGISASLHLVEPLVDAAIGVAEEAKKRRLDG